MPCMPISGWMGDNLVKKSDQDGLVEGAEVTNIKGDKITSTPCTTAWRRWPACPRVPPTPPCACPFSGIYKIKGVGDVLAGRVEQGVVKPGEEVVFLPTHTKGTPCEGKVFTVEMHHKRVDEANPGDNVGLNIKGLHKQNMPRAGDVMIYKNSTQVPIARTARWSRAWIERTEPNDRLRARGEDTPTRARRLASARKNTRRARERETSHASSRDRHARSIRRQRVEASSSRASAGELVR